MTIALRKEDIEIALEFLKNKQYQYLENWLKTLLELRA